MNIEKHYEAFFGRNGAWLLKREARFTALILNTNEVDDIRQDIYTAVLEHLARHPKHPGTKSYLERLVLWCAGTHRKGRVRMDMEYLSDPNLAQAIDACQTIHPQPDMALALDEFINGLETFDKKLWDLLQTRPIGEIAETLGVDRKTVLRRRNDLYHRWETSHRPVA